MPLLQNKDTTTMSKSHPIKITKSKGQMSKAILITNKSKLFRYYDAAGSKTSRKDGEIREIAINLRISEFAINFSIVLP